MIHPATNAAQKRIFLRQPVGWFALITSAIIVWFHVSFWHHAGGFWRDEINLLNLAGQPGWSTLAHDSFPILMPLLVRGWLALGFANHEPAVRFLGLLIGLSIPMALWLVAWRTRRAVPMVGLALIGLNSTLIVFGDSLRAYGLGCLLILLTLLAAMEFLKQPNWRRTFWLALLAVLSVQTLYHNAVLIGAICLGAWVVCWRRKDFPAAGKIFLAGFLAFLSLLPYVPALITGQQSAEVIRTGLKSWRFLAAFQDTLGFPLPQFLYVWLALVLALVILAVRALPKSDAETPIQATDCEGRLFAGVVVVSGVAGYILFLRLAAFPSQSWYLLPLTTLAAGCFEIGLPMFDGKKRTILLGLLVATVGLAVPAAKRDLQNRFTNINAWTAALQPVVASGDYIVVVPWFCGITFDHYFHGVTPWATIPPLADHTLHRYDLVRAQIQNPNALQPVLENIRVTLQRGNRVWILAGPGLIRIPEPGMAAPPNLPPAPLEKSGWSEAPYTFVWDAQMAQILTDHAVQFQRVQDPADNILCLEKMELFKAEGWKTPTSAQK